MTTERSPGWKLFLAGIIGIALIIPLMSEQRCVHKNIVCSRPGPTLAMVSFAPVRSASAFR